MPSVGFDTWYKKTCPTVFIVQNVARDRKCIHIFNYPINYGKQRDLMDIPYVSEADIRHSLLKGELFIKILAKEIFITDSNIDLLQFDPCHKAFLEAAGITVGLEVDGYGGGGEGGLTEVPYLWRISADLIGPKNNANRVFMVPSAEKFIEGTFDDNDFHIEVDHNGRRLIKNIDYILVESGGIGTGYDGIQLLSIVPNSNSKLIANYVVRNV